jgi:crossover junction endodeoxyribonuclease RuvC
MKQIIGIDPGFASMGLAHVQLLAKKERVLRMGVIRTQKSTKKQNILATEDNIKRTSELYSELQKWMNPDVIAICAEGQSWPRNASSSAKVGMAWGVIVAIAEQAGIPIIQASPQEIKKILTGKRSASKLTVQIALIEKYELDLSQAKFTNSDHCFDALAAIVACLKHPAITMARTKG